MITWRYVRFGRNDKGQWECLGGPERLSIASSVASIRKDAAEGRSIIFLDLPHLLAFSRNEAGSSLWIWYAEA